MTNIMGGDCENNLIKKTCKFHQLREIVSLAAYLIASHGGDPST
jgi:hypothetical protein